MDDNGPFLDLMKDILEVWPESIVFHVRDEGHLGPVMASVLSFMKRMKDILKRGGLALSFIKRMKNIFKTWIQKDTWTATKLSF